MQQKRIIQVTWLTQAALVTAFYHPVLTGQTTNIIIMLLVFALMFLCRHFAKQEKLSLAANTISITLTFMILIFCALNQGVRDEALLIFPAIITFAVLTGTERLIFALYTIITSSIMLMALTNETGIYVHLVSGSGLTSAILVVIILTVVTYSIRILGVDITRANRQLRKQQKSLEEQLKERTDELQQSLILLKRTQEELLASEEIVSLGKVAANVAHEINTPIAVAITATSAVKENTEKFKNKVSSTSTTRTAMNNFLSSTQHSAEMIADNLDRAANIITEFKQASNIQNNEQKESFNLYLLLLQTLKQLNTNNSHMVTLEISGDENIYINQAPEAIKRIITNLYHNSISHGFYKQESGTINIYLYQKDDKVIIDYRDNGLGIPDKDKARIFEPFFTTKREQGGTGLGMHILYNLITRTLNGKVTVSDNHPRGVCFTLVVPIS